MKFNKDMILETDQFKIGIDAPLGDVLYISHAHRDHVFGTKRRKGVIASEATLHLGGIDVSKRLDHRSLGIELVNAGHILGSTQLVVDTYNGRVVYTGDFKLRDGLIKGAEIVESDILVIESTYGHPNLVFPDQESVWEEMIDWVKNNYNKGHTVLLGGFSVGKAQEIINVLNREGIEPVVHDAVEKYCKIYDRFGLRLNRVPVSSEEGREIVNGSHFIGVVPQHILKRKFCYELSFYYGRKVVCAAVTGQYLFRYIDVDKVFPISDHADFNELLEYVLHSDPKQIYCIHGHSKILAKELVKRGYKAEPIQRGKTKRKVRTLVTQRAL